MNQSLGLVSLIFLVFLLLILTVGRQVFPRERLPAVPVFQPDEILIELGLGVERPGIYQFSDAQILKSVISLTNLDCVRDFPHDWPSGASPESGQRLDLFCNKSNLLDISLAWMPASKRMALGIPLHPERMSQADWQALPGIGPRLATRIEEDRQMNGGFGDYEALIRVPGIGPKRIADWRGYFSEDVTGGFRDGKTKVDKDDL
ncbi:competence protein ComEA [Geoalkalibacter ferrihydriticus]|uniref:Competence protein ComEA n=1 Tax=Geoalkalibacter ferrihydriticus TaxID=392333 RepID=A0A1G9JBH7_9BACT|nr:helix-hairpin-helix domain-containing protein [Geoalkalibacter ferrihydriticus]SDL34890.1 competence protein ComEA [Geoalkalibacter ferrihydriticus]